ncbi:nickel-dependent hydrogenase large subunit [Caproiciproducens galactitolivorans]|uniref:Nickel-dependent hydrogenase large subunit n=1 Tax=Caproiciproducens galactitolivorans TaxID=642589 RepID=A0ABT4BXG9_9FIRM|nr:nickel-dependent hydrogenase large subunit [Caproiciproducens galactitolivorans]MCY1714643.1 nickel-dependent hydrogenase large subunit [Caproiciproducens galactitolivorans]
MSKRSIVPFGPHHPVLPEPIHLDLVLEDEKVVEAVPSIGFIHRGLEKLVEKKDFNEYVYVAERICGICSFMHGMGYCEAVEHVMGVEIPPRAKYLRTIWCEMSRLHSHLMWLGLLADAFGFESLFMQSWRMREKILDMFEASTGGRVIFSVNKIGGEMKDMDGDMLKGFLKILNEIEKELRELSKTFLDNKAVNSRLQGVGFLTKQQAHDLGTVGPFMRASGIDRDTRNMGYAAYSDIDFETITSNAGDSYARTEVRIKELFQSIDIIRQAVEKIPSGEIAVPVKGFPDGEYFMRVEQPRGEAVYYVKGNGTKFLDRVRVRTPTFANLPGMLETLKGSQLADVPILILTIDPCISCTER